MDQYWNEFIHQSEDEEVVQGMDFIIFTKYILFRIGGSTSELEVALQTKKFRLNFSNILCEFWLIASRSRISNTTPYLLFYKTRKKYQAYWLVSDLVLYQLPICDCDSHLSRKSVSYIRYSVTRSITFWLKFKRNAFISVSTYISINHIFFLNPSSSRSSSSSRSGSRSRSPEARIPSKRKKKKTKKRGKSSKYYDDGDEEHHRHKGSRTSSRGSSYWEGKRRSRSPISSSSRSSSQSRSPSPNINHGARIRLEDQTSPDPNRTLNEKTVEQLEEEKRKLMKDLEAMKGTGSHSL